MAVPIRDFFSVQKKNFKYMFYTAVHPFDGFYELKHRNKGSLFCTITNLLVLWFSYSVLKQYVGFPFLKYDIKKVNSIADLAVILLMFLLFCAANWSVTTLFEGEGRFKDIVIAAGYSLLPMNLFLIPATIFSRFLAEQEAAFYQILIFVGIAWFAFLLFVGCLTVHNYSLAKSVIMFFMTAVAMFIILFLMLLFFTVAQQILETVKGLYVEISYRV